MPFSEVQKSKPCEIQSVDINIPLNSSFINTAVDLIVSSAMNYGLPETKANGLRDKAYSACSWVLSRNGGFHRSPIPVKIGRDSEKLFIELKNQNDPITMNPAEPNQLGIKIKPRP